MSKIDDAVTRVMGYAQDEASPRNMSKAEAVDFYEALMEQCRDWVETIRTELS